MVSAFEDVKVGRLRVLSQRRFVSLDKKPYPILLFFTQVYRRVLAIIMLGTLRLTCIPSSGE